MKYSFLTSLFFITLALTGCAQNKDDKKEPKTLPAKDFQTAIQKEAVQVLDVRTASEYAGGHIQNALQANWNDPKELE